MPLRQRSQLPQGFGSDTYNASSSSNDDSGIELLAPRSWLSSCCRKRFLRLCVLLFVIWAFIGRAIRKPQSFCQYAPAGVGDCEMYFASPTSTSLNSVHIEAPPLLAPSGSIKPAVDPLHEPPAPLSLVILKRPRTGSTWLSGQLNTCLLYTSPSPRD